MSRRNPFSLVLLLALLPGVAPAQSPEPQLVPTPRARVLPVSPTNRPFLAAARAQQPVDLAARGYAERELILSGYANIYEWSGEARDARVTAREEGIPYATRVLVRRPADARRASGLVIVELLDPAGQYDAAPLWGLSWEHITRRGDVWVGITIRPAAIASLRTFDPVRYAALGFARRQEPDCRAASLPAGPPDPPDAESGLAWDVIAQAGALLRSASKENPLGDISVRHVIAAGYSLSGSYVTTYANAVHRRLRRGDGAPIYDGFLSAGAYLAQPINQCASPLPEDDPRRAVLPRDVPFVAVATEADFNRAPALRRDDSNAPDDRFRLYEIAGAGHLRGYADAGEPGATDLGIAGLRPPAADLCEEPRSDFPLGLAFSAIWQQYAEWLAAGTPMTGAPRIATGRDGAPLRDELGNATGGWRLPQLDVPVASYTGGSTPRAPGEAARLQCSLTGAKQAFDVARLRALYRSRAEYLRRFDAAVDAAVAERRLVKEDAAALKNPPVRVLPAF